MWYCIPYYSLLLYSIPYCTGVYPLEAGLYEVGHVNEALLEVSQTVVPQQHGSVLGQLVRVAQLSQERSQAVQLLLLPP